MEYNYFYFESVEGLEGPKRFYYTCKFKNLYTYDRGEIELSKAKHCYSQGKPRVMAVIISDSITHYIPSKLTDHFRNLVALKITGCELRTVSKEDLPSSLLLKELLLSDNHIESLPGDLFDNTPSLEILCFRNNKIKFISYQTLKPLKNLKFADFRGNVNINEIYKSDELLPGGLTLLCTLQGKIFLHCKPVDEQTRFTTESYVQNLWKGEFSDFKIKTREETFKVHKNILAVTSPVFAAMFSHEMQENLNSEMTIENFSPESIKEFLAFVYLRQTPQKCFNAVDLYKMSMEYQVKELSAIAQWFIIDEVKVENASEMFKLGALYDNAYIKEAAFQAIEKFFNKKLPKELMESEDGMMEILEIKDKVDEVLNRNIKLIGQSKWIQTGASETECKIDVKPEVETEVETVCS